MNIFEEAGIFKSFLFRAIKEKHARKHGRLWKLKKETPDEIALPLPAKEEMSSQALKDRQDKLEQWVYAGIGGDLDTLIAEVLWYLVNKPTSIEYITALSLACGIKMGEIMQYEISALETTRNQMAGNKTKAERHQEAKKVVEREYIRAINHFGGRKFIEKHITESDFINHIYDRVGSISIQSSKKLKKWHPSTRTIKRMLRTRDDYPLFKGGRKDKRYVRPKIRQT